MKTGKEGEEQETTLDGTPTEPLSQAVTSVSPEEPGLGIFLSL